MTETVKQRHAAWLFALGERATRVAAVLGLPVMVMILWLRDPEFCRRVEQLKGVVL